MANFLTILEYGFYIAMLCFMVPLKIEQSDDDVEKSFEQYMRSFNKSYENETVYNYRLLAFQNSLNMIQILNQNRTNSSAYYALTKFSDLYPEEFHNNHLSPSLYASDSSEEESREKNDQDERKYFSKRSTSDQKIPKKVDWREKNAVTKLKNQNQCGACWAFSTIETIESMYAIKYGKLESFSVQQMIDCSSFNYGCQGGDMCKLLQWILLKNVKVTYESNYPLMVNAGECRTNDTWSGVEVDTYDCSSYVGNEEVMLQLIALIGPITVAVNARTWQNYAGGIIQFHCDEDPFNLNHAVQIVGYDLTSDIPHYIARNTWGEDFGENGYLYIAIGDNVCGVANEVAALKVL